MNDYEKQTRKDFYRNAVENRKGITLMIYLSLVVSTIVLIDLFFPGIAIHITKELILFWLLMIATTWIMFNSQTVKSKQEQIKYESKKLQQRQAILEQALIFKTITAKELQELEDIKIKIVSLEIDMKLSKGE